MLERTDTFAIAPAENGRHQIGTRLVHGADLEIQVAQDDAVNPNLKPHQQAALGFPRGRVAVAGVVAGVVIVAVVIVPCASSIMPIRVPIVGALA